MRTVSCVLFASKVRQNFEACFYRTCSGIRIWTRPPLNLRSGLVPTVALVLSIFLAPQTAFSQNSTCSTSGSVATCSDFGSDGVSYNDTSITTVVINDTNSGVVNVSSAPAALLRDVGTFGNVGSSNSLTGYVTLSTDSDNDGIPDLAVDADGDGIADDADDDGTPDTIITDTVSLVANNTSGGTGGNSSSDLTLTNAAPFNASAAGLSAIARGGDGGKGGTYSVLGIYTKGRNGGSGSGGGSVTVNNSAAISSSGVGVLALSQGGDGGNGGNAGGIVANSGKGGDGGSGGTVNVNLLIGSQITTNGTDAIGVLAESLGGDGGKGGGSGGVVALGGKGGDGGDGGNVSVNNFGSVTTQGTNSYGVYARSYGDSGGSGGSTGGLYADGGNGGSFADGGIVTVSNSGAVKTTGEGADGIIAQSVGGGGGDGGSAGGIFTVGGRGGSGGDGNTVTVTQSAAGSVTTNLNDSSAIVAQSIGGGGGNGGDAIAGGVALSVAVGGTGGAGGDGKAVIVTANGELTTKGEESNAILAQSIGGGGGTGGISVAGSISPTVSITVAVGGSGGEGGDAGTVDVTSNAVISTEEDRSSGIVAQSIGGGGGNGGLSVAASISAAPSVNVAIAGGGDSGGSADDVTVKVNSGSLNTVGANSYGIFAQSIGGGGGSGGLSVAAGVSAGGSLGVSLGGAGSKGGVGGKTSVFNAAEIDTTGSGSYGIFAQSVGGGGGEGGMSIAATLSTGASLSVGLGGDGGSGAIAKLVDVDNTGRIITRGGNAYGILAQSVGGSGGAGGNTIAVGGSGGIVAGSVAIGIGGSGGTGGVGGAVNLDNTKADPSTTAADISTLGAGSTALIAQSIGGGGGSGGYSVAATLTVSKSGGGAVSVALGGNGGAGGTAGEVTTNNSGNLDTTGDGASGIVAQSLGGAGGVGGTAVAGALNFSKGAGVAISVALGGSGGSGGVADTVTVDNDGTITTAGADAYGLLAQSVGGSGGVGGMSIAGALNGTGGAGGSVAVSLGGLGGDGGEAGIVTVTNDGEITTTGARSSGVVAQSIGGEGGVGGLSVGLSLSASKAQTGAVAVSLGGSGGTGGTAKAVNLTNTATVQTSGSSNTNAEGERVNTDAHALIAQSIGGSGGIGGFGGSAAVAVGKEQTASASISVGGAGGDGGKAGAVTVNNSGDLSTGSDNSIAIVAQSIGGGGGAGGGSVALSFSFSQSSNSGAVGVSIGGGGGAGVAADTVDVDSTGNITTLGDSAYGILAQSIGGDGGLGGFTVAATGTMSREVSGAIGVAVGGAGGTGGTAEAVTVGSAQGISGNISTLGENASAIVAQSIGGGGGAGGFAGSLTGVVNQGKDKSTMALGVTVGGFGGKGGKAGTVDVNTATDAFISTKGDFAYGILAQSIGGKGGNGGGALGAVFNVATGGNSSLNAALTVGGFGGAGADADTVSVDNDGIIVTGDPSEASGGKFAHAILAQSIGGDGGAGGFSGSIAFAVGSSDQSSNNYNLALSVGGFGGTGADAGMVDVDNSGTIIVYGERARGIFAQSVGGGGGAGGDTGLGDDIWGENFLLDTAAIKIATGDFDSLDLGAGGAYAGGYGANSHSLAGSVGGFGGAGGDGSTVNVSNSGSIYTFGTKGHAIFAQSVGGGGGQGGISTAATAAAAASNSTSISLSVGGFGGAAGDGGDVIVDNAGQIITVYHGAYGVFAQSVGGGGGAGGDTRGFTLQRKQEGDNVKPGKQLTVTVGGFGGVGGDSGTVDITNSGSILTFGTGSIGIFAQTVGGGGGTGGSSSVSSKELAALFENDKSVKKHFRSQKYKLALGGFGGSGGEGKAVTVNNSGAIYTLGEQATGIYAQSVGGGGGTAGKASTGFSGDISVGGFGGVGNHGGSVVVANTGAITTQSNLSDGIFAQSVGGGGGDGGAADFGDARSARAEMIKALRKNKGDVKKALKDFAKKVFLPTFGIGVGGFGGASGDGGEVFVCNGANYDETTGACTGSVPTATISTTGNASHGIFAQSVGGGGGTGGQAYLTNVGKIGIGGLGGAAGDGGAVSVVNSGDIVTQGNGSYGVFAQSVGGGGGLAGDITFGIEGFGRDETKIVRKFSQYTDGSQVEGIDLDGDGIVTASETADTQSLFGFDPATGAALPNTNTDLDQNGLPISDELLDKMTALLNAGSGGGITDPLGFTSANPLNGQDASSSALDAATTAALSAALEQAGFDMKEAIVAGLKKAYSGSGLDAQIDALTNSEFAEFIQKAFTTDGTSVTLNSGKVFDFLNGITGDGGTVDVTTSGNIVVTGGVSSDTTERAGSIGIFAQSVGGGGGIVGNTIEVTEAEIDTDLNFDGDKNDTFDISDGTAFAGTVGGKGAGGKVNVTHTGSIIAPSLNGIGIFAQSTGGDGGDTITVTVSGGTIQGGELYDDGTGSAAAIVVDGGKNNLINIAADSLIYAVGEQAIIGGDETETVTSSGEVIGNIDLDVNDTASNTNDYNNEATGILETRKVVDLAGGSLTNNGKLDLAGFNAVGTTTLTGNYNQTATANFAGDFNFAASDSDLLTVSGTTSVAGLVTPNLISFARITPAETFISAAGGATDNGMDAVDTLTVDYGVVINGNDVQLAIDGIDFTPASVKQTRNQTEAGDFINTILRGDGSEDLGTFFAFLGNLKESEKSQLVTILQRIHPEIYAVNLAPHLFSALRFGNQLHSCPKKGEAGVVMQEGECMWARISGGRLTKGARFDYSRVKETSHSFSAGVQLAAAPSWHVGAAIGYEKADLEVGDLAETDSDRFNIGGVVKYQEGALQMAAAVSAGYGWYETDRFVNLTAVVPYAGLAEAEHNISHANLQFRGSYQFDAGGVYLKPAIDLNAVHLHGHAFQESGAGALNLHIQNSNEWVFTATPSLEVGAQIANPYSGTQFRPFVKVGLSLFNKEYLGLDATFEGAPSSAGTFTGVGSINKAMANLTAGLEIVDPQNGFDVRLTYDGHFGKDDVQAHSGSARLAVRF